MRIWVPLLVLPLVLGAGCAVPPSKFGRDIRDINAKADAMQEAFDAEKFGSTLDKAEEVAKLGDMLTAKILIGDPLRKNIDDALAKAREVRKEVQKQQAREKTHDRQHLEGMAKLALEAGAANEKGPRPPPPGAESMILVGSAPIRGPEPDDIDVAADTGSRRPRRAGGEVDLDRNTSIVC